MIVVRLLLMVMRMVITFLGRRLMCQLESQDGTVISPVTREFHDDGSAQGWGPRSIISTGAWPTARLWRSEDADAVLLDFVSPVPSTGPDLWKPKREKLSGRAGRIFRDVQILAGSQRMRENSSGDQDQSWLEYQAKQRWPVRIPQVV